MNDDLEKSILTAMLNNQECLDLGALKLKDTYFIKNENKLLFQAMKELLEIQKRVDIVSLSEYLKDKNILELCGGIDYITELFITNERFFSDLDFVNHLTRLREKAAKQE